MKKKVVKKKTTKKVIKSPVSKKKVTKKTTAKKIVPKNPSPLISVPKPLSMKSILGQNPQCISRDNTDGTIAIMTLNDSSKYFVIDGVASHAWRMLNGKRSIEAVLKMLLKKSDSKYEEVLEKKLMQFLSELLILKIIKIN